ncbi:MAG: response regulator [Deltaproteobacteria bacterium]|nr:response regulator [Deltaproteobacteria bacterium]
MSVVIKAISRRVRLVYLIATGLFGIMTLPTTGSLAAFPTQTVIPSPAASKAVLLLYSAGYYLPAYRKNMAAFMSVMDDAGFPSKNIYLEDLDLIRNNDKEYRQRSIDLLHQKYDHKKIDLIVTIEGLARDFILKEGKDIFPTAPTLCILSADTITAVEPPRRIIQLPSILDISGTLEVAVSLFPKTKRIVAVLGNSEDEQRWELEAKKQFAPWAGKLEFEYTNQLTYEETLQRLSSLPPDTVVIYIAFYRDKTGRAFVPAEVAKVITKTTNSPVFGVYDQILDLVVGGSMISYAAEGARAAKLALDILNGKYSLTAPITNLNILTATTLNWRQLNRWGISESKLPKGSIVINRPPSLWTEYHEYVIGAVAFLLMQSFLIVLLLIQQHRRRLAEAALRESEETARMLLNIPNAAAFLLDSDGICLDANETMAARFGRPVSDIVGLSIWNLFPPEVRDRRKAHFLEVLREKKQIRYEDERQGMVNDSIITPILDDHGQVVKVAIFAFDITDRRRLEAQLRQAQKMEAIGTLAGGIAHDFNNILGSIFGYTQLALDDAKSGIVEAEFLKGIFKAAKRARDLVQQILVLSRQSKPEKKPVDISLIIEEGAKLLRASLPANVIIQTKISTEDATVLGDPIQLHQVLINLGANAAHAMAENGGALYISLNDFYLDPDSAAGYIDLKPGPYFKLTVSDSGHGIDRNIIDRIFDPFFTTKDIGQGSGMGLAIVHGVVKNHGGVISVYSPPGHGATFNILLPAVSSKPESTSDFVEAIPTGTESVLLVDDEPGLADTGKMMLERLGYRVTVKTSGVAALGAFMAHPDDFDLLITDMAMPHMTGDKLAQEIMRQRPDLPVILCTGYSEVVNEEKAREMGCSGFLMKPIDITRLAKLIRQVLAK